MGERIPPVACFLSRVTIAGIAFGIRTDYGPAFGAQLECWLRDGVRVWFGARILDVDEAVLLACRRLVTEGQGALHLFATGCLPQPYPAGNLATEPPNPSVPPLDAVFPQHSAALDTRAGYPHWLNDRRAIAAGRASRSRDHVFLSRGCNAR
jgi:hypothetical protein